MFKCHHYSLHTCILHHANKKYKNNEIDLFYMLSPSCHVHLVSLDIAVQLSPVTWHVHFTSSCLSVVGKTTKRNEKNRLKKDPRPAKVERNNGIVLSRFAHGWKKRRKNNDLELPQQSQLVVNQIALRIKQEIYRPSNCQE